MSNVTVPAATTAPATLGSESRVFWRYPSPRLISVALGGALAGRLAMGRWGWWDLAIPLIVLALEPFTEWVIHVFLLHFRPREVRGRRVDPLVSRKHREHHADPRDRALVFVPVPFLVPNLLAGAALLLLLVHPVRLALTAIVASYAMLLAYEWTHHLIHSRYLPKTRAYRYVWRAHRLHHFRNEHYWFGVTMHLADHVLRTFPEKDAVPLSPTCRTLGVDPT